MAVTPPNFDFLVSLRGETPFGCARRNIPNEWHYVGRLEDTYRRRKSRLTVGVDPGGARGAARITQKDQKGSDRNSANFATSSVPKPTAGL
jgi:hypothetical protein